MLSSLTFDAEPGEDDAALERLAVWAFRRYSPIAADTPDGLLIDATGAAHLQGGEVAMLADMVDRLTAIGVRAGAAMAATYGAAYALARYRAQPTRSCRALRPPRLSPTCRYRHSACRQIWSRV